MPTWAPWLDEQHAITRAKNRRNRRKAARDSTTPAQTRSISDMRRAAPWVPPAVLLPMQKAGMTVDSPQFWQAAQASADIKARTGHWANPGEMTDGRAAEIAAQAGRTASKFRQKAERQAQAQINRAFGNDPLSPDIAGDVVNTALDSIPVVSSVKALAEGKGIAGAVYAGIPGTTGILHEAQQGIVDAAGEGLKGAGLEDQAKGLSRGFMLATQFPMDIVNASIRSAAANNPAQQGLDLTSGRTSVADTLDPTTHGIKDAPNWPKQSQGGQALIAALNDEPVDVGSGYFPSPESTTAKKAAEASRKGSPFLIGGHAFTLGRFVANTIFDPDTVAFNALSGAVDAAITIKADPTNPVFAKYTEAKRAGKTFTADVGEEAVAARLASQDAQAAKKAAVAAERARAQADRALTEAPDLASINDAAARASLESAAEQARLAHESALATAAERQSAAEAAREAAINAAGGYKGHRSWTSPKRVSAWLDGADGSRVVDWGTENTSPYKSWETWGRQGPIDMHVELADATTPEQTREILGRYLGTDVREVPGSKNFRYGFKASPQGRWAQQAPNEPLASLNDLEQRVTQVDRQARNANLPADVRNAVVDDYIRAGRDMNALEQAHSGFYKAVEDHLVTRYGISRNSAQALTEWSTNAGGKEWRKYFQDQASGLAVDQPFAYVDGAGHVAPSPHLMTEQLSSGLPFTDFRAIRRATKMVGGAPDKLRGIADRLEVEAAKAAERGNPTAARGRTALANAARDMAKNDPSHSFALKAAMENLHDMPPETLTAWERRLRSAGSKVEKINTGTREVVEGFGNLWRRSKLARPAWGLRVVGEEQARLWAYGFTGAYNHPIQLVGILAGAHPDGKLAKLVKLAGKDPTYADNGRLADSLDEAMNTPFSILYPEAREGAGNLAARSQNAGVDVWTSFGRGHRNYETAVAEEMVRLHNDKIVQGVLSRTPDDAVAWLGDAGAGEAYWRRLTVNGSRKVRYAPDAERVAYSSLNEAQQRAAREWYVQTVYDRVEQLTKSDPDLKALIRDGGAAMPKDVHGKTNDLTDLVKQKQAEGWTGPDQVRAREFLEAGKGHRGKVAAQAFDSFMWHLMPQPSNYLSRSPMFKQTYWQRGEELVPFASPEAKAELLDIARKEGVPAEQLGRMKVTVPTEGGLDLADLDQLAKAHALNSVKDVLYDLSERGQIFDALRAVIPFGEAWKEVLTRWTRAIWENPKIVHRVDQGLTSARESGIITKDPLTGQEVVLYPGTEWITDKITGVPMPLQGSVQGVNIAANGLPGVGPAVSIPLPFIAKAMGWNLDDPKNSDLMEVIYPYGNPTSGNPWHDVVDSLLPTWLGKAVNAVAGEDATSRSTLNYTMNYLASTGKYDLHGARGKDPHEEMQRLIDDAAAKAKTLQLIRAGASAFAPSAPIPKWLIRDPNNKLQEIAVVRTKYQEKLEADGPDAAMDWLMNTYGADNFLVSQGFTTSRAALLPRTKGAWDFVAERPWLREKYGETYGLIVHDNPKDDFDITGYSQSVARGEREPLSAKERLTLANARLASYVYDQTAKRYGANPTDEQQADLDSLDTALQRDYPGYKATGFDYRQTPRRIAEIERMVNDPQVTKDPAMRRTAADVRTYLAARQSALDSQAEAGLSAKSISTSESAAPVREWLVTQADELIADNPDFAPFWNYVFRREIPGSKDIKKKKRREPALIGEGL